MKDNKNKKQYTRREKISYYAQKIAYFNFKLIEARERLDALKEEEQLGAEDHVQEFTSNLFHSKKKGKGA